MTPRHVLTLLALAWLLAPLPVRACNIPVFRYALERWRHDRDEDRYQVTIFHRGPLADDDRAAVEELRAAGEGPKASANVAAELVDVAGPLDDAARKLWQAHSGRPLPWMVVRFPDAADDQPPAWAGPLSRDAVRALVDSPARREIARRLLKGDSVVWVLLEGDAAKTEDETPELLSGELKTVEKTLKLPDGVGEGESRLLSALPLRIAFSVLRVARADPAERMFVAMLLGSQPEEAKGNGPLVFPVFGRGRVLTALTFDALKEGAVKDTASFLCGDCSCLVKRLNPGTDLLMSADWDAILDNPAAAQPDATPAAGQSVPIPGGSGRPAPPIELPPDPADEAGEPPVRPSLMRTVLLAAVAGAAVLVVVTGLLLLRSRQRRGHGTAEGGGR